MTPHCIAFDKTPTLSTTYVRKLCFNIGTIFRFLHCACSASETSCEIKTLLSTCRTPSTSPICLRPTPPPPLPPALGLRRGEREFLRLPSGETKLLRPRKETNSKKIQQNMRAILKCNKIARPIVSHFVRSLGPRKNLLSMGLSVWLTLVFCCLIP